MKTASRWVIVLLALTLLLPALSWAQGGPTGEIRGVVQDEKGGVIVDAKITVVSKETGQTVREIKSSSAGTFFVPLLAPGFYRLEITVPGFSKFVADDVIVRVTETSSVVATMKVGTFTETVTVIGIVSAVNVASAVTGQTVRSETVTNLPLSTGNFLTLLTLSAGANTELFDNSSLGRGAVTINVNGQRPTNNNYQLEGINANDINLPILDNVPLPNPHTIEEFKAQTSLYDASQGRNAGGNIQVNLRSGTKDYHGELYELFRDDTLNANDWFLNREEKLRPTLKQNQFGGSFGGPAPLIKNMFFFVNYQGTRAKSGISIGTFLSTSIPVLPSDRSQATLISTFFPSGLPPGFTSLDPVALAFLNLPASKCPGFNDGTHCIPTLPGTPGFGSSGKINKTSISRSSLGTFQDDQFVVSVDKKITSKDKFTGRWFFSDNTTLQPFGGAAKLPFSRTVPSSNRFLKAGWNHVFSPSVLNDFRFGFSRFTFARVPSEPIALTDIGATRANSAEFPAAFEIIVTGGGSFSLGTGVNDDRGGHFNTYTYADDVSITKGKHLIRFGGDLSQYQLNRFNRFATRGSVTSGNTVADDPTTGIPALAGFQNFLLGRVTTTQGEAGFHTFHFRAVDAATYIQDDWKITKRLTINAGLRYELLSTAHEKDNFLSNFRGLQDGSTGTISIIHPAATARVGTPGVLNCTLTHCMDKKDFAPRASFAWDVLGNQRWVIRGGGGIYYQRVSNQTLLQTSGGLPFAQAISAAKFSVTPENPFPSILPTSAFPLSKDEVVPALVAFDGTSGAPIFASDDGGPLSGFFFFPVRSYHAPYGQQWNLGTQYGLGKNWVLEVGYVGTHGVNLLGTGRPLNPGQVCTALRPCIIPSSIGSGVTVPAGTPFVTKDADGTIEITGSTADNIDARVPTQFLGLANSRGFFVNQEGNSIYHSLQVTLSHQWSNGLYFQGAYTWSKAIDNGSGSVFGDELNGFVGYGDLLNSASTRSLSDFDRTHRFVASFNYELPFARWAGISNHGFGRVVHGWMVSGVVTIQSGTPFTLFDSSALTLQDTEGQNGTNFATLAPGATLNSTLTSGSVQSRVDNFVDLTKFIAGGNCVDNQNVAVSCSSSAVVGAAIGNVGRNTFRGPHQQNWDLSIGKSTKITERVSFDIRADFFNAWNHPSFQSPQAGAFSGSDTVGNLGQVDVAAGTSAITGTVSRPRILQFGAKLSF